MFRRGTLPAANKAARSGFSISRRYLLRSPANLKEGSDELLKLVDTPQFRSALYGKKLTRLTLFLNRCTNNVEIEYDLAGDSTAASSAPDDFYLPGYDQADKGQGSATVQPVLASCNLEDPGSTEVLMTRRRGQDADWQALVASGKLRQADLDALLSEQTVKDLMKSKDDFILTQNRCNNQLVIHPGVATTTVQGTPDAPEPARSPSLLKTVINMGAGLGATGLMFSGGGAATTMLAFAIGGSPMLIEQIWKKFHHARGEQGSVSVSSTVRYPQYRDTFQMKGNWWEDEF